MKDARKFSGKSGDVDLEPPPRCGIGTWAPTCLQPMANIRIFLFFLCGYAIFYGMIPSLLVSQLSTIEKVFGFTSSMSGMIVSSYEIGFLVTIIFVGHFGDRLHTPRIVGTGGLIFGICGLLYSLLHLMSSRKLGSKEPEVGAAIFDAAIGFSNNTTTVHFVANVHFCTLKDEAVNSSGGQCSPEEENTNSTVTYAIFIIITVVSGFAATPVWTIAITYLDDNSGCRRRSSLYIGLLFSLRTLAPVIGMFMGAAFSTLPVDLEETSLSPEDHNWVGAWWLGFVICGTLTLIFAFPLLLFPRVLMSSFQYSTEKDDLSLDPENDNKVNHSMDVDDPMLVNVNTKLDVRSLPRALIRLARNGPFVCVTLASLVFAAANNGYFVFLPKYLEKEFHQTTYAADIITGVAVAFTSSFGYALGGFISARVKWPIKVLCFRTFFILIGCELAFPVLMGLTCSSRPITGVQYDRVPSKKAYIWERTCNDNCHCKESDFDPVCGVDDITYFSPCHAGCKALQLSNDSITQIYSNCSCIRGDLAFPGTCPTDCQEIYGYGILLFGIFFLEAVIQMPWIMLMIRCVDVADRSLAMAIVSFFTSAGLFPVPVLYGSLIDSTCLFSRKIGECGDQRQSCLIYDHNRFRYYFHGLTLAFRILLPFLLLFAWLKSTYPRGEGQMDPNMSDDDLDERFRKMSSVSQRSRRTSTPD